MPLLPKGGQMAIRSQNLPQSRISAQCGVAAHNSVSDHRTSNSQPSRSKTFAQVVLFTGLSIVMLGSTGCTMFSGLGRAVSQHDGLDKFMISHRNSTMAAKAWHCQKGNFCNPSSAFKDGFYDGYAAVAKGGVVCPPTTAPSKYWGWMYQSSNGQSAVNDWFAGYPMGVQAARQDCIGDWSQISTTRFPPPAPLLTDSAAFPTVLAPAMIGSQSIDSATSPFIPTDGDVTDIDSKPIEDTPDPNKTLDKDETPTPKDRLKDALDLNKDDTAMQWQPNSGGYSYSTSSKPAKSVGDWASAAGVEANSPGESSSSGRAVYSDPAPSTSSSKLPFSFQ